MGRRYSPLEFSKFGPIGWETLSTQKKEIPPFIRPRLPQNMLLLLPPSVLCWVGYYEGFSLVPILCYTRGPWIFFIDVLDVVRTDEYTRKTNGVCPFLSNVRFVRENRLPRKQPRESMGSLFQIARTHTTPSGLSALPAQNQA